MKSVALQIGRSKTDRRLLTDNLGNKITLIWSLYEMLMHFYEPNHYSYIWCMNGRGRWAVVG